MREREIQNETISSFIRRKNGVITMRFQTLKLLIHFNLLVRTSRGQGLKSYKPYNKRLSMQISTRDYFLCR